jgi:hypothetical protein
MEILRVAENIVPSNGVEITIVVPGDHSETTHALLITDLSDLSISAQEYETSGGSEFTFYLNSRYDNSYLVELLLDDEIIFEETYEIVRPYVNPSSKGTTASQIAEYARNEELARAIIDSVTDGFYYQKKVLETTGQGADYIPVWQDVKKIVAVYENNELVTDRTYSMTSDRSAIVERYDGRLNRDESASLIIPAATSDSTEYIFPLRGFPRTFDYKFVVEHGYTIVPSDIVRATELLVDDISCGRLEYFKRYVADYNTDQFKMKFDGKIFDGTGNLIVDKILSKYSKPIKFLGVL